MLGTATAAPLLVPVSQAFGEGRRQAGVEDLLLRGCDVVRTPAEVDEFLIRIIECVAGLPLGVPRLPNGSRIEEVPLALGVVQAHAFGR